MFIPNSDVKLLHEVDITNANENTFSFASAVSQSNFFSSKMKYEFVDLTYVRKERYLKVEKNIETLFDVSYLMFQNANFGDKWFYAFITDLQYLNDETTKVFFEIDEIQTWYFDIDIKDCYIEREHVEDDTIGLHLIEENFNTGEYISSNIENTLFLSDLSVIIGIVEEYIGVPPSGSFIKVAGSVYGGIYSGLKYFEWDASDTTGINEFVDHYAKGGQSDAITNMFIMPSVLIAGFGTPNFAGGREIISPDVEKFTIAYSKALTNIDTHVPKNNKLFTYPYNFMYVSNNNGNSAIFKYEFSTQSNMQFELTGDIAPNTTAFLTPLHYLGSGTEPNYEETIKLSGYPLCSWVKDIYANWVAQNYASNVRSLTQPFIGERRGNDAQIALAGGLNILDTLGGFQKARIQPDQVKGSTSGGANTAIGIQDFTIYKKSIRKEYAVMIDSYFNKHGYRVNELKTPNLTSRTNWNYIKTSENNIFGNIPNNSLKKIKSIFNKGVTFWHNDDVGNYDRTNTIV